MTFGRPLLETRCFLLHLAFGVKTFTGFFTFHGLGLGVLKILKCITFVSSTPTPPPQVGGPIARSLTPACQTQRPGKLWLCIIFFKTANSVS